MKKNTSRVPPDIALVPTTRRRRIGVAALAAAFSLAALYVAWHEANGPDARPTDELPITQARADAASQPAGAAAMPAGANRSALVKRGEYLARRQIHSAIRGRVFTPVWLIIVPQREGCPRFQLANESAGPIGRAVVDDQPFKVAERLGLQALKEPQQSVAPVERWGEKSEQHRELHRQKLSPRIVIAGPLLGRVN